MTSLSGSVTASYQYRADGMWVAKTTGGVTTRYRHDGQMGIEDVETSSNATTVTRYGPGARGVDMIERTQGSTVTLGFPIYDAHGNNVGTLSRNGTGWALNDRRSYDAWGTVGAQQSAGDPKLRYCANLGHKQDDEIGLIYMRTLSSARPHPRSRGRPLRKAGPGVIAFAECKVYRFPGRTAPKSSSAALPYPLHSTTFSVTLPRKRERRKAGKR